MHRRIVYVARLRSPRRIRVQHVQLARAEAGLRRGHDFLDKHHALFTFRACFELSDGKQSVKERPVTAQCLPQVLG